MSYSKNLDFASMHDQQLLGTYLDAAISSNDLDTVHKILINLNCGGLTLLHKITDEKMMQKMIEKWKICAMGDSSLTNIIIYRIFCLFECVFARVPIVRICLDYLVDPNIQLSPPYADRSSSMLGRFGCYAPGYRRSEMYNKQEYPFWTEERDTYPNDSSPTADADTKRAKHDELMKVYLEYYPSLKKKYSYGTLSNAYDSQSKYIISRITKTPEERVPTLKLIIDTFGHANQPYLADLFMKSCASNNIPRIVCMLELNPAFHANIQNGIVVDYGIQNEDMTNIKNKLNETIAILNNIDAEFSNIKSQLNNTIEQTDAKFANIKSQLDNTIEQIRAHTTHNNATMSECSTEIMKKTKDDRVEIIEKSKDDHAETIAELKASHVRSAEIMKKMENDHTEIIKKLKDDHAEIIKKLRNDHAEATAELNANHVRSIEIMKRMGDDHAELKANHIRSTEIIKQMRDDHTEIIKKPGDDRVETIVELKTDHVRSIEIMKDDYAEIIKKTKDYHAEIIKKLGDDYAEALAESNVNYTEIVKKTKDDHAEIIKKTEDDHTELRAIEFTKLQADKREFVKRWEGDHAERSAESRANFIRCTEIMKKMGADQAEIMEKLRADQTEIMEKLRVDHTEMRAKLRANYVCSIERVTKDHATEITKLRTGHAIEITKLEAQYQL